MLSNNISGNSETIFCPRQDRFWKQRTFRPWRRSWENMYPSYFFKKNVNSEVSVFTTVDLCYGDGYLNRGDRSARHKRGRNGYAGAGSCNVRSTRMCCGRVFQEGPGWWIERKGWGQGEYNKTKPVIFPRPQKEGWGTLRQVFRWYWHF